jgi:hypothetical protein
VLPKSRLAPFAATTKDQAANVADTASQAANDVAGTAKDQAATVATEAKTQARDLLGETREEFAARLRCRPSGWRKPSGR